MKKIISAVLIIAMAASMAACGDSSKADESGDYIYGEVQSVSGNDVVIHVAKYNEDKDDSDDASESDDTGSSSDRKRSRGDFKPGSFDGSMPEGFDPKNFDGSRPEGFDPEQFKGKRPGGSDNSDDSDNSGSSKSKRQRPDMSGLPDDFDPKNFDGSMPDRFDPKNFDGSMPDGFDPKNFDGSMPEGMSRPDGAGRKSRSSKSSSGKYTVTDEEQELRIPVGTNVTTSSGVKTSFDKIAKGDIIKCSVEKGDDGKYTVKEVWIMDK